MHPHKVYGRQASFDDHRRSRKRIIIIGLSTVALAVIVTVAVVTATHGRKSSSSGGVGNSASSFSTSLKAVCDKTVYPASCFSSLSPMIGSSQPLDPVKLFHLAVQVAMDELPRAVQHLRDLGLRVHMENLSAMDSCAELLELAMDRLNDTAAAHSDLTSEEALDDLKAWLSAVITYKDTCMDAFEAASAEFRADMDKFLKNSTEFTSNSLAILTQIANVLGSIKLRRRLLEYSDADGLPRWLSATDRRLLQSRDPRASANIVVAKDGSGKYKTIKAALAAVPDKSNKRFVIYVKKGVYNENVKVEKNTWNVMMVGDGKDATIVSGSLNFVDGTPTFKTATFSVLGKGFIARDMGFRNTAGPAKHQAVALMSNSDLSVFYRCRFDAYQDTLYANSLRQFYRECDIYGTVDFIFGNAAVVLQACNIFPRVPMKGQWDTITAQGKTDPNQNTGIVLHACSVQPFGDLSSVKVYLGRPWKDYSTTVFMKSVLSGIINPAGWLAWSGNSAPSTIFYAEYQNTGPGSSTKNRVKWKGVRTSLTQQQASGFTVGSFLAGNSWIPATAVPFNAADNSMASVEAFGQANPLDPDRLEARRRTRKRIAIIGFSTVALAVIVAVAIVSATHGSSKKSPVSIGAGDGTRSFSTSLKAVCDKTVYPDSCFTSLSPMMSRSQPFDPLKLFHYAVRVAMEETSKAAQHFSGLGSGVRMDDTFLSAMDSCGKLLGLALDLFNDSAAVAPGDLTSGEALDNLKTWLSAVITYHDTCLDGFETASAELRAKISAYLRNSTQFTSNSLAILTQIANVVGSIKLRRRLLEFSDGSGLPGYWLSSKDRRLLQSSDPRSSANVVVAKDGSGKYKTINAALKEVPEKSNKRFVIYVKKGFYNENVRVAKNMWNVMVVGDGKDATTVSGSLNAVDGTPTFETATFAVFGRGFIARDMGFRNTAGATKHQAVAMMASADQVVFYRCLFDAFQDTLYLHSQRQFYRDCDIYGTVDFIFGNAVAVLQACSILPRVPMTGQQDTITAQGKTDPNQNTGISIHACSVRPFGNLSSVRVYLGRPWKPYSTTVFMRSTLSAVINPAGWLPWSGDSAPSTIYYGEHRNVGPGARTKNRVKWKGLRTSLTQQQANGFTVGSFISGNSWQPATGVRYFAGLELKKKKKTKISDPVIGPLRVRLQQQSELAVVRLREQHLTAEGWFRGSFSPLFARAFLLNVGGDEHRQLNSWREV
ncbi:hypothetical protein Taro_048878 [Colocasia esculenta]|uniref:pectinesterase n=1 Tax=Colocasia esculenta TaxID=4460 RepID=A0A843X9C8_COLES|nr:hypothetical protein [Colocasia esculenta]